MPGHELPAELVGEKQRDLSPIRLLARIRRPAGDVGQDDRCRRVVAHVGQNDGGDLVVEVDIAD
jgi:hypothetical protein